MKTYVHKALQVGELIVAAFDEAARYSADPREVSLLATRAVTHILRGTQRILSPASLPTSCTQTSVC